MSNFSQKNYRELNVDYQHFHLKILFFLGKIPPLTISPGKKTKKKQFKNMFPRRLPERRPPDDRPGAGGEGRRRLLLLLHLHLHQRALPDRHQDGGRRRMRVLREGRVAPRAADTHGRECNWRYLMLLPLENVFFWGDIVGIL